MNITSMVKFISIPRLSLSVKVSKMLKDELDIHVHDEVFWTDCQLVLGYTVLIVISVVSKYLLQTVQQIWDYTSTKQWHYVQSGDNPDDASRGLDSKMRRRLIDGLMVCPLIAGSSFLCDWEQCWEKDITSNTVPEQNPELGKVVKVNVKQI